MSGEAETVKLASETAASQPEMGQETPQLNQSEGIPTNAPALEEPTFGLGDLFATLVDLKTLPHLLLLLILSTALYALAQGPDATTIYSAIGFISLSFGYALTATSTRWEFAYRMVRVEGISSESWLKSLILRSLKAWSLPLILSTVIGIGLIQLTRSGGQWDTWIPLALASMFLLWSIGQGMSFKSGTSSWIANGQKMLDTEARERGIIGISFWQIASVSAVAVLIGYVYSSGYAGEFSTNLKWIGFIVLAIAVQIGLIYFLQDLLGDISTTKGGARFAARWGILSQIFVTWHLASAWRRLIGETSAVAMIIEEIILMVFTVLLAIWSLASRDVSRGGKLFTSENALFWGLAFGFGYAGSIAMITNLSGSIGGGSLATTMAIGHIVTALTLILIHSKTLRNHKNRILNPPQNVTEQEFDTPTPVTLEEGNQQTEASGEELTITESTDDIDVKSQSEAIDDTQSSIPINDDESPIPIDDEVSSEIIGAETSETSKTAETSEMSEPTEKDETQAIDLDDFDEAETSEIDEIAGTAGTAETSEISETTEQDGEELIDLDEFDWGEDVVDLVD